MIEDPIFWVTAVIAVLLTGVSKGGLGGLAIFAVPILALRIPPLQAAGIMLPILVVMDWTSLWSYRGLWKKMVVMTMLPGAILGVAIGGIFAGAVNEDLVRVFVGLIAIVFPVYVFLAPRLRRPAPLSPLRDRVFGVSAGVIAGFTSFIAHAGGPIFQAYVLPKNLEKRLYAGTAVMFFAVVNLFKLIPYTALGQFDATNLKTSAMLIPLAPIGVWIGVWAVKRVNQVLFYRIIYFLLVLTGMKLIYDGLW